MDGSMNPTRLEKLRSCGRLETYSTARHHLCFYNNVSLTATYISPVTHQSSLKNLVFVALHHVITHHPNLSAVPVNEGSSYPEVYFARLPEIDLHACVEFLTRKNPIPQGDEPDQELDEILHKQHSTNFKANAGTIPYWRLIIASSPETSCMFSASCIFHHALSDGASSVLFHESFLDGLNAASLQNEVNPLVRSPSTPLLPPLEDLHSMSTSWSFFLLAITGFILSSYFAPRPSDLWTGLSIDTIAQTRSPSCNTTVALSVETTTGFARKCREERTSVTAALSTLLATVLFPYVNPHNQIRINTPISLRRFVDIPDKLMVYAITNHTSSFHRKDNDSGSIVEKFSWDTARQVKNDLVKEVGKKGADNPFALLKFVSNIHEYFLEQLGKPRSSSGEVSNLGNWRSHQPSASSEFDGKGTWSLGRMTFSQSLNRTGAQVTLSVVTGGDGCMVLNFNWPEDSVKHGKEGGISFIHKVPDLMKRGIEALAKNEQS